MTTLLLNKPYGVLSQFTPEEGSRWRSLSDFVDVPQVYAAGRLDADSEGLLILTSNGRLQQRLTDPRFGHWRSYWAQVEGTPNTDQLRQLCDGVVVQGRRTLPAKARWLQGQDQPQLPERTPPIRFRSAIPTSWLQLSLTEGRNRQVRRMTAAVGLPTLRLVRCCIDLMDNGPPLDLTGLHPGSWRAVTAAEQERLNRLISSSSSAGAQRGGHRRGGHRRG